jgi:hypothetical protein
MKIAVLYREDEKKTAGSLIKLLSEAEAVKKNNIPVQKGPLKPGWTGAALEAYLDANRFILILPPEGFSSPWVSYLAGFCRRNKTPFIAYGTPASGGGGFEGALAIAGEEEFKAFLDRDFEAWKQAADYEEAREILFTMGVPCSEESFAACVREKRDDAVRIFLAGGFSPDSRDKAGVPLLSLAARSGDEGIAQILLDAGAAINAPSQDRGGSALIDCALGKYRDIADLLLKAGADTNLKSKDGQSALTISVGLADGPFVELLLKAGANADEPDALGASARKYAALFNKPEIVELFEKYAGTKQS